MIIFYNKATFESLQRNQFLKSRPKHVSKFKESSWISTANGLLLAEYFEF